VGRGDSRHKAADLGVEGSCEVWGSKKKSRVVKRRLIRLVREGGRSSARTP